DVLLAGEHAVLHELLAGEVAALPELDRQREIAIAGVERREVQTLPLEREPYGLALPALECEGQLAARHLSLEAIGFAVAGKGVLEDRHPVAGRDAQRHHRPAVVLHGGAERAGREDAPATLGLPVLFRLRERDDEPLQLHGARVQRPLVGPHPRGERERVLERDQVVQLLRREEARRAVWL